ncbi:uncharacterized protein LOC112688840 [Sipha flava]|uniref:Uncharacterized protein LOC112688840 n=2 Tax=Sipha flava TaxID=143950 RepID=A0A8B8G446_9HEMI|nr:uncharacterized protein LOC112688840 [Sipha flava]
MQSTQNDLELKPVANMLDVYRSDSQKSDSSQRPRVSFNRDVRIKKIGNSDAASIVEALAGDGEGHLVPTPVRREKIKASKRELALEADRVLKQADSVASLHSDIPPKRQPRSKPVDGEPNQSLQRKSSFGGTDSKKWNSEGKLSSYMSLDRPKNRVRKREPPTWEEQRHGGQQYRSSTDLTAAVAPAKRRSTSSGRLTRSVSDAGDRGKPLTDGKDAKRSISLFGTIERIKTKIKKRPSASAVAAATESPRITGSAVDRSSEPAATASAPPPAPVRAKKQLSPIIESSPRDEYFKYSTGDPFDYGDFSPPRPVRGHKVDRIVRQLQHQQQQQQQQQQQSAAAAELARAPSSPDFAHAHNGNEPFSYTSPTTVFVHLPDADRPSTPPPQQYRSAAGMDDTWTSYDDLSHRRDALESRLQKRASATVARPQQRSASGPSTVRVRATPDTYATVYKKNETLGGGDRYFERKIVTEHRFARRTPPMLSADGEDDGSYDGVLAEDDHRRGGHHRDHQDGGRRKPPPPSPPQPPSSRASGMPTIVSRNNVAVVNGPSTATSFADKPAKKRSRLDKFKMLFTGGGGDGGGSSASKENKRPSPAAKAQYNSSDPESYTSSLRKRYNVFTGSDNNKHGNRTASGNRRMSSPIKPPKTTGNNAWFKSLDRFGKKNNSNNKRSKTFTSGSENDDEIRVHRVNDRTNPSRGTGTRSYHSVGNLNSLDMDQSPRLMANKRHSLIDSSAGSTTEGDSSQKSHKSTVYLHATTVGEIPESRQLHQSVFGAKSRRAASREELSSQNDAFGGAHKRTLSRSVSVLAPWAPRPGEGRTVDYDERGRPPRAPSNAKGTKHAAVKATRSDPEESAAGAGRRPSPAAGRKNRGGQLNRGSSGEESSLLDEVIIRTTSRTGKLIKDDRSTSRQIGRSMSSANRPTGGTLTRVRTKS